MHENSGNSVIYYAHYTEGGVNKTGLTVTITVYEVIRDGTKTEVVTDGACTEVGDGLYRYLLASGTVDAAAEYVAVFHTATDTVDAQDIPAMWVIDRAGTEKLDTGITLADDAITAASLKADAITEITDDIFAEVIENSLSYKQVIQVMAAVLAGKVTGGATGTITFKDLADAVNRVVMTVDASGNRSAVQTNFS